jgi:hypothetical protein
MASKALPTHLRAPAADQASGNNSRERHHAKSQSHMVSPQHESHCLPFFLLVVIGLKRSSDAQQQPPAKHRLSVGGVFSALRKEGDCRL